MQKSVTQAAGSASAPQLNVPPVLKPAPSIIKPSRGPFHRVLAFCASLRITVILFVLAFILVFYGTWAQVDAGIWTVVNQYFRGWFVWLPVKIIFLRVFEIPDNVVIPYPGGKTLGALLLINLLAAHAVRFKLSWKR